MKPPKLKRLSRFSLLSMIMLITWLSCLLAPMIQRRDHIRFFEHLGGEDTSFRVGWHDINLIVWPSEFDRGHGRSVLATWFSGTPLESHLDIGEDRTISAAVKLIDLKDITPEQLAVIGAKLPNCIYLETIAIEGPIPPATAKHIGDCKPLANLNVLDCDSATELCLNLKRLENLKVLAFKNCKLSQQDLEAIGEIKSLRFVCFVDSNVSQESIDKVRTAIPKCYAFRVEPDEGLNYSW